MYNIYFQRLIMCSCRLVSMQMKQLLQQLSALLSVVAVCVQLVEVMRREMVAVGHCHSQCTESGSVL